LIDTVKEDFADELIPKISRFINPQNLKYIIVNHIEPDHSGAIKKVLKACPNATIFASELGKIGLEKYYTIGSKIHIVRTGDEIIVCGKKIQFVEIPMAHWPDSMVSWIPVDRILFSSDAFGQLIATSQRFDYELSPPPFEDASIYYANILQPYNYYVLKTFEVLQKLNISPEYVLPDHGVIWKDHITGIFNKYLEWATGACANGVLILYDTMWNSTEIMAEQIVTELLEKGINVNKLNMRSTPMSTVVNDIMHSKVILIGSPTINQTIFPSIGRLLSYIKGLNPGPHRFWSAFGSYGWGGGAVEEIIRFYKENQYEIITTPVDIKFRPNMQEKGNLTKFVSTIVEKLKEEI